MSDELRITDTNSANDSKGRALGFEGNDFLYIVGGIVGAIGIFLLLYAMFHAGLPTASACALPILVLPTAWVMLFRRNRPDGYAEDFFDHVLNREGFACASDAQDAVRGGKKRHAQ
ncbi:hypothetical protein OH491_19155 [Termitidicoccus mucosus]|uniref:PrgI family protein n=1 Tax=Termitidicoccus mucosus TaxID=1184151 RepID=A0A178IJF6_9BACT|nr:hypothetical protein AW736_09475 [Opitutaceae bacterium TSB47]